MHGEETLKLRRYRDSFSDEDVILELSFVNKDRNFETVWKIDDILSSKVSQKKKKHVLRKYARVNAIASK